ncbi:MAG: acetoacetate--CoA ligase [Paracoccaceae bacterium]
MEHRKVLWRPSEERANSSSMKKYINWLHENHSLEFSSYDEFWNWSINDLSFFWQTIWDYFELKSETKFDKILEEEKMPGACWFPGASINFVDEIFRYADKFPDKLSVSSVSETFGEETLTWAELKTKTGSLAAELRRLGIKKGDRVVAVLPNTPHALISFYATASIGAIWSLCAPDMGEVAILDRFRQIEPKILICQSGYIYAEKFIDKTIAIKNLIRELPSLKNTIVVKAPNHETIDGVSDWDIITNEVEEVKVEIVPFNHPLWIVYSSGTTGNPKPIVHGHGGILVEMTKQSLHMDLDDQDHFCWLTSSGWIMWNVQSMALLRGSSVAMFDFAPNHPDMMEVWRRVDAEKLTYFGAGAAFFSSCMKVGIEPKKKLKFNQLRSIGSTGSPLSPEGYRWIYDSVKSDVWLAPISGGTDLAGAFVLGNPMDEVREGEMQARSLGCAVQAFDEAGNSVVGQVGELVCTKPLPSMPLYFWGDDGNKKLIESYFDTFPKIWKHGDWIEFTNNGGSIIYGRSDATINRKGLRLGSSEIYRAVESLNEIEDSLVIDLEYLGRESFMVLFVVTSQLYDFSDALKEKINSSIKSSISARFLPNEIVEIKEVPRTLSGKKLEVPVKKLLLGGDPLKVVNRDSMANPLSFDFFVEYMDSWPKRNIDKN